LENFPTPDPKLNSCYKGGGAKTFFSKAPIAVVEEALGTERVYSCVWHLPTHVVWDREFLLKDAIDLAVDGGKAAISVSTSLYNDGYLHFPEDNARNVSLVRGHLFAGAYVFDAATAPKG